MNWYILGRTTNYAITGTASPQAKGLYSPKAPYRLDLGKFLYEQAPDELKIPSYKLEHRAKLTDLVQGDNTTFPGHTLISKMLLECLFTFRSPGFQKIPTVVIDKKDSQHPYFFFMQFPQFDLVDYSRSIFSRITDMVNGQYSYEDFQATSFEDVRAKKGVGAKAIFMKENFDFDFFILPAFPFLWMVNEKIADALREAKITGICLIPFHQGENFVDDNIISKAQRIEGTL